MIVRFAASLVLVWILGFLWFVVSLPGASGPIVTDAVVVPTGGAGRIKHGIEVLEAGRVQTLFVSGVDPDVTPDEFAAQFDVDRKTMNCCVALGYKALDTHGNAAEIAQWIAENDVRSVRLVTHDWHMRRAALELERAIPGRIIVVRDAVPSQPGLGTLFLEYHKLVAIWARGLLDWWPR
ncbi:MAG: hypothetical protein A3J40_08615 [Erythrobacter sp. RIFCSPHIGHO2_12_FULL_63_10]|nr:MAG: hypothetical protein A3J40_08615 [Erythrobacter sp. RIFCSPHIGHO2_12_FULL_63_10]